MSSITIQDATDLMVMIEQLNHKAETGQDATEEQIALRMLGSGFETSETPIADVVTASSSGGGAMTTFDRFDDLESELNGTGDSPEDQAKKGKVPQQPPVTVLPNYDSASLQANYTSLVDANTLCSLYTKMLQVKKKPRGFDITSEAPAAFAFIAKSTFDIMTSKMAGFYNFSYGSTQRYNNTVKTSDIHEYLIGKVFDPFSFDANTHKLLDGQLTTFVKGVKNINTQKNPTNTLDFCLLLNLCPKVNVTGDPNDKDGFIFQPSTYLVYMKIKASSFAEAVKKNTTVDKVDFHLELTITKCNLNVRLFEANRPKFDKIFEKLVGQNLRGFSDKVTKRGRIKSNESNPGANIDL